MSRLTRFTPLTGVVFALLVAAGFLTANGAAQANATPEAVRSFAIANSLQNQISDSLWILGFVFLLFFAGSLHAALRSTPLTTLLVAGAAIMVAGGGVYFGFDAALDMNAQNLSPDAAQAINILALSLGFPMGAGGLVFGIASGLAILRTSILPKWLGIAAIVIGVILISPLALFGVLVLGLWAIVTSIALVLRTPTAATPAA
jgi:hypothetical protein